MGFFARIFGISKSRPPENAGCWKYSGGRVEIDIKQASELSEEGGAIQLEGKGLQERILVLHGSDGEYHAIRNKCTHMGRRLDFLAGDASIRCCSISKSTYSFKGDVISGPAKGTLKTYQAKTENNKLVISIK